MSFQLQSASETQSTLVSDSGSSIMLYESDSISQKPVLNIRVTEVKESLPPLSIPQGSTVVLVTSSKPPRDTGFAAMKILAAATLVQSVVLGVPLAFGVFQDHYTNHMDFPNKSHSSWIGVLSSGLTFLGAPVITYLCEHYTWNKQIYIWIGWVITVASLLLAALRPSIASLIVTQGFMYGFGALVLDMPILIILNTWFLERRGLAYGLVFGGTDLFGVVWTFLNSFLLSNYGLRNTLLIMGALIAFTTGPAIMILKERDDSTSDSITPSQTQCRHLELAPSRKPYYHRPIFYILAFSNLFQALAIDLPYIYLPSFATNLGFTPSRSALLLAIANLAQIVGETTFGKMSDKLPVHILVVVSSAGASLVVFLLWGFATTYAHLVVLAILFGYFGSGFIALWARMGTLFGEKNAQIVYSVMSAGRGLGTIASGPISAELLKIAPKAYSRYGGGSYIGIVLFIGACMAGSALLGGIGLISELIRRSVEVKTTEEGEKPDMDTNEGSEQEVKIAAASVV